MHERVSRNGSLMYLECYYLSNILIWLLMDLSDCPLQKKCENGAQMQISVSADFENPSCGVLTSTISSDRFLFKLIAWST
jgi:hypothetical protein